MGKAGKARKKQKLDREAAHESVIDDVDMPNMSIVEKVAISIQVFEVLGQRLDIYDDKKFKLLRKALFPLLEAQRNKFFENDAILGPIPNEAALDVILSHYKIAIAVDTAMHFSQHMDEFNDATNKPFRKAMHPLVLHKKSISSLGDGVVTDGSVQEASASLSNRISSCLRIRDWVGALTTLRELESTPEVMPKLGSLQRWVRDCDILSRTSPAAEEGAAATSLDPSLPPAKPTDKNTSILLLDAVLRVMRAKGLQGSDMTPATPKTTAKPDVKKFGTSGEGSLQSMLNKKKTAPIIKNTCILDKPGKIIYHPEFTTAAAFKSYTTAVQCAHLSKYTSGDFKEKYVRVVSHVKGPDRRPPSEHDQYIYMLSPNTIELRSADAAPGDCHYTTDSPLPQRHDVPHVPGAFLITGALTPYECDQFVAAAEAIQFSPEAVLGIDNVTMLADDSMLNPIFDRVKPLLPATLHGGTLAGVNARWRLFRYYPGAVYRPHIDGAWPGSGLDPTTGELTDDLFGDRISKLTFLIYLNGGFNGGATTFFQPKTPDAEGLHVGSIEAWSVQPQQGAILCFPHGEAIGSLVHEGSAVLEGAKYVIRSDVLYTNN